MSHVSGGKNERVPRARLLLSHVLVLCSDRLEVRWVHDGLIRSGLDRSDFCPPAWDAMLSLLYTKEKHGLQRRKREETRGRGRPSGLSGPSYPSCRSHQPCRCQQGQLHVVTLFVSSAMRRRRLPIMASHSISAGIVVN